MIKLTNIKISLIYLIFIFFGLNVKLIEGFYIYNALILIYLILNFKSLTLSLQNLTIILLIIFISCVSIGVNSFFAANINLESFFIIFKTIIFVTFFLFFRNIKFSSLNYNILLTLTFIPVFLSIIMFHDHDLSDALHSIYGLKKYEAFGRYGGVFGIDVNSLGMFSTLTLVLAIILRKLKLVGIFLSSVVILFSFYAVLISGMRSGILVFIGLMMILDAKLRLLNIKYIFIFILLLTPMFFIFLKLYDDTSGLMNFIFERFSLSSLISDLDISGNGGNLNHMINHFNIIFGEREINLYKLLFGFEASLNYVDSFYLYIFLKHGFIFVFLVLILFSHVFINLLKSANFIYIYFLLTTVIIALKGTFILGNFYMFLVLFAAYLWKTNDNFFKNQLNR